MLGWLLRLCAMQQIYIKDSQRGCLALISCDAVSHTCPYDGCQGDGLGVSSKIFKTSGFSTILYSRIACPKKSPLNGRLDGHDPARFKNRISTHRAHESFPADKQKTGNINIDSKTVVFDTLIVSVLLFNEAPMNSRVSVLGFCCKTQCQFLCREITHV